MALIDINLLPRDLRKVKEPAYWRLIALIFPLLTLAAILLLQLDANARVSDLESEVQQLEDQLVLLQPALREQQDMQARQRELNALLAVAEEVGANRIDWTGAIVGMLEMLPALSPGGERRIDFRSLSLTGLPAPQSDPARFEGLPVVAEMTVNGNVRDTEVLAEFIRALEDSTRYGVAFQRAVLNDEENVYSYALSVGMYQDGGVDEAR